MSKKKVDSLKNIREMLGAISDPLKEHRELMASIADPLKEHRELMASFSDPLKEHRELIESLADPLKEHRELMASFSDPLKEHRELIESLADPLKEHREMMASIADPLQEHRELMKSLADPLEEHREMLATIADPLKEHRELMASLADPLKEHRALMASLADPLEEFRASIAGIPNPLKELSTSITGIDSFELLRNVAFEIGGDLSFDAEGLISVASKRMAVSDLQDLSYQVIHDSSLEPSGTLEESLNNLINEIRSQKDPLTQKLLMWFVYPLIVAVIVSFINPVVNNYVESHLNEDKRSLSKKIEANARRSVADGSVLKDFRYVTADTLNVRSSATQKSKTIGLLYFGYAVIIVDRQKSWTLVEWNDPDSEVRISGWVFSRYLAKFN
ncbi:SH3 domain-containing protein [Saccharospirillum salsuginis]|uniref:SH3b domain-containing protein n=1 Tax=Saccharospirillum salsuginis TaxID=418750 RepID=A0A918KIE3_9GAMM|nr:SH3 domain-containing protein [Saccharospirillum salsuginis]GGX63827.1 hypothetical protein GCM10007392_34330 [Saccharospirillum salsuginis]